MLTRRLIYWLDQTDYKTIIIQLIHDDINASNRRWENSDISALIRSAWTLPWTLIVVFHGHSDQQVLICLVYSLKTNSLVMKPFVASVSRCQGQASFIIWVFYSYLPTVPQGFIRNHIHTEVRGPVDRNFPADCDRSQSLWWTLSSIPLQHKWSPFFKACTTQSWILPWKNISTTRSSRSRSYQDTSKTIFQEQVFYGYIALQSSCII